MIATDPRLDNYKVLHAFIARDKGISAERSLTDDEMQVINRLDRIRKANKAVITELLIVKGFLERTDGDMRYITRNLHSTVNSLKKQRGLVTAVMMAFYRCRPTQKEMRAIAVFIKKVTTRHNYVVRNVLNSNLELTPFYDYMKIVGEEYFIDDLRRTFPQTREYFNTEKADAYLNGVLRLVKEHGMENDYRSRLEKYIRISDKRDEAARREREAEKRQRDASLKDCAEQAIISFRGRFLYALNNLQSNSSIGLGGTTVKDVINRTGREGYVVLVSYVHGKHVLHRYAAKDRYSVSLHGAEIFKTEEEAADAAGRIEEKDAKAATYVVSLDEAA